jgi:hypothetical protein
MEKRVTSPHLRWEIILSISATNQTQSKPNLAHQKQMNQKRAKAEENQAVAGLGLARRPGHAEPSNQTRPKYTVPH